MKSHLFTWLDPISILDFLKTFKRACNDLAVHYGAALFLFAHLMQGSENPDLLLSVQGGFDIGNDENEHSNGALRCYDEFVNYLFQTYADDGTISATGAAIIELKQRENQSNLAFNDVIFVKTSRCGKFYSKAALMHRFLQGWNEHVRKTVIYYYTEHLTATLDTLARYAMDYDLKSDGSLYTREDRRKAKKSNKNNDRNNHENGNRTEHTHTRETTLLAVSNDDETRYIHRNQQTYKNW